MVSSHLISKSSRKLGWKWNGDVLLGWKKEERKYGGKMLYPWVMVTSASLRRMKSIEIMSVLLLTWIESSETSESLLTAFQVISLVREAFKQKLI